VDLDVRPVAPEQLPDFWRVLFTGFGSEATEPRVEEEIGYGVVDRAIAAFDGEQLVGTASAIGFELTLPGGALVPVAGVTSVAVSPTHRRRGALTAMMRHQLDDVAHRGEPIAVLTASEAQIYGRFGYGRATRIQRVTVSTRDGLPLRVPADRTGTIRFVHGDDVIPAQAPVADAVRLQRSGELSRTPGWWDVRRFDREEWRDGASHRFDVVHERGGVIDGAMSYRIKSGREDGEPDSEVRISELFAVDPEVEVALLTFAAEIDLTARLTLTTRPDHPLAYRLVDSRRYFVHHEFDHLYVRVLDVPRVLSARTYEGSGSLVLAVDDPFLPASGGSFRLVVADDGTAECEQVDVEADLSLDASTLGSLVLGDVAPTVLAEAGRLVAASPAALRVADRLFPTAVAPYCTLDF
jgi:predicted acetyltransferase